MIKFVVPAVVALFLGVVIGWFLGRARLEKQWQSPFVGHVMKPMPFGRSRKVIRDTCAHDPVVYTVAAVGSDEASTELHVVVENHGSCKVTELTGTAYGFDASGKPSPLGLDGLHRTAFEARGQAIAPGESANVAKKLNGVEMAALAVAQIDSMKCADGTSWARR